MKPLIYFENADGISRSGIGRAMRHQLTALSANQIETTIDKHDEYDIAHINTYFAKSQQLLRSCKKRGIPVIVHGHSTYEDFRESFRAWRVMEPFFDSFLKYMYSRADYIIAPTPYARDLIASYPFVHCEVTAVSNGIDVNEYQPSEAAKKAFRERFHMREGEPFVIGIGFPFMRKGIQDFIEVARSFPHVKFFWFGGLERILTSPKVLKVIKERPDNVIMPGYVNGEVIRGAYQQARAMFFPSYEETEGIVVLEALASRCPLVCRDIGVYHEWLFDGKNAHLGHNNEEFIAILQKLLTEGEDSTILDCGYQTAFERNLTAIGAQLAEKYEYVLRSTKH